MSVSLTITNLDDETFRRLQAEAQRHGVDVEAAAKSFLSNYLPKADSAVSNGNANGPPYHDLDFLIGTWTEQEAAEFLSVVSEFRRIDPGTLAVTEILLDTNAYAAAIRGDAEARWIVQQAESIAINSIVLGELLAGFRLGRREQENRDRLSQFLSVPRVKKLVLNETTAEHYASLKALLRTTGKPIPTNDLWIAATAFQYNLVLFSFDAHFQSIPNLKLITKLADFPLD